MSSGAAGVVGPHHALDHEGAAPLPAQPGDVVPAGRRGLHPLAVHREEPRGMLARRAHVGHGEVGQAAVLEPLAYVTELQHALWREAQQGPQVHLLRDRRTAPVPAVGERPVQGDDQALGAGLAGSFGPLDDLIPRARPVALEEQLRVDLCHGFHRHAAERAEAHRRSGLGRAARHSRFAVGVHGLHAGRGRDHRQGDFLPEHRGGQFPGGRQVRDVRRREPQFAERGQVVLERNALLGSGHQRHVDRLRQVPLSPPARLLDRLEPLACACHRSPSHTDCRTAWRLFWHSVP